MRVSISTKLILTNTEYTPLISNGLEPSWTHFGETGCLRGIPFKRARQRAIDYLEYEEIEAVLKTINRTTRQGCRDYALLATMFNTGGRVQEIADLRLCDLQLTKPFQVKLFGKGRKERYCPLWPQTAAVLRAFCSQQGLELRSEARVFLNHRGQPLTRFGIRHILARCLTLACDRAPNLRKKRLHPHSVRHSTAVALLTELPPLKWGKCLKTGK